MCFADANVRKSPRICKVIPYKKAEVVKTSAFCVNYYSFVSSLFLFHPAWVAKRTVQTLIGVFNVEVAILGIYPEVCRLGINLGSQFVPLVPQHI